jgi:hypothetical protein
MIEEQDRDFQSGFQGISIATAAIPRAAKQRD